MKNGIASHEWCCLFGVMCDRQEMLRNEVTPELPVLVL